MKPYREKFGQQMGNDLNTSMGVTALFDVLKLPADLPAGINIYTL